ncbi:hypothetical protein EXIGLDRAFT_723861 [Exidia glandulosa HHB12029]|uniref:Uncharacterized protein n=1 Tax=Exidia glandulosa HHB12029 TaxID=1314781 RepID=A0A165MUK8_EXIGL|nr:hypothetical protein EXIGLDRAFT_723861 [Exidia glandulosa HHB12029]
MRLNLFTTAALLLTAASVVTGQACTTAQQCGFCSCNGTPRCVGGQCNFSTCDRPGRMCLKHVSPTSESSEWTSDTRVSQ